jgi:hypothetical protein
MRRQRIISAHAKAADAGICPNITSVAPVPAELYIVLVRRVADAIDGDQFMLAAEERTLAGICLNPDDQIEHIRIDLATGAHQDVDVPPVHADKVDGAIAGDASGGPEAC